MTMIIAVANEKHSILVADRRITDQHTGSLIDDNFNKLCVFFCEDAKMAVAFTGLATFEEFNTSEWIATALSDVTLKFDSVADNIFQFKELLEQKFQELKILNKRLLVIFSGFVYWENRIEPKMYIISNFESSKSQHFTIQSISSNNNEPIVEIFGDNTAKSARIENLKNLLSQKPASILRLAVSQIQKSAKSSESGSRIGEYCNSAILLADVDSPVTTTYHTPKNSKSAYGPNVVIAKASISFGYEIFSPSVLAGPEIRKKDPCWCGSGLKFKDCHMKKYGAIYLKNDFFRKPMMAVFDIEFEKSFQSGKRFFVVSGYA
jgi:hypothetical protein